jgi:uncharacterized protein YcbK (DUF882 family)
VQVDREAKIRRRKKNTLKFFFFFFRDWIIDKTTRIVRGKKRQVREITQKNRSFHGLGLSLLYLYRSLNGKRVASRQPKQTKTKSQSTAGHFFGRLFNFGLIFSFFFVNALLLEIIFP